MRVRGPICDFCGCPLNDVKFYRKDYEISVKWRAFTWRRGKPKLWDKGKLDVCPFCMTQMEKYIKQHTRNRRKR